MSPVTNLEIWFLLILALRDINLNITDSNIILGWRLQLQSQLYLAAL